MSSRSPVPAEMCHRLIGCAQEILYHLDDEGRLAFLNSKGAYRLEAADGDWRGKPLLDFAHEDDRSRLRDAVAAVREAGSPARDLEIRLLGMKGGSLWTRHVIQRADPHDAALGLVGAAIDIDETRRLEDQLQQSQKLETIGLLAGGIAHDFNNMLAAILGFTELMVEEREPGDPDLRTLSYIQKSTERAASLVKQLLVYSRKSTAELKQMRLGEVVQETLGIIGRTMPKSIRIVASTDEEEDAVLGDSGRIQQALMNLCLNARDAMPRGGELRIAVEKVMDAPVSSADGGTPRSYTRIKVQDTGTGMSPEILDRIWEPFFTTKGSGLGTGLGLAVVQSIVSAHGGYLQVESQPGSGTTFYLYLPSAPVVDSTDPAGVAEPPGGDETILVVDDEDVLLDLLATILERKGYRVVTASSGSEALDVIKAAGRRIHLVISDNMMPGMMGWDLAAEIKRVSPETKLVLCSGYTYTDAQPADPDNVFAYVRKPYQRRELLSRVREVLDS